MEHSQNPLAELLEADPRYSVYAYVFIFEALTYTSEMLGMDKLPRDEYEERHVTGQQLLEGLRQLALKQFGFLAKTVWEAWGIRATRDWGEIVFNLVNHGLMRKTETDSIEDFADGFDVDDALEHAYFRDRLFDEAAAPAEFPKNLTAAMVLDETNADDDEADEALDPNGGPETDDDLDFDSDIDDDDEEF